jgi:hypothetical protein
MYVYIYIYIYIAENNHDKMDKLKLDTISSTIFCFWNATYYLQISPHNNSPQSKKKKKKAMLSGIGLKWVWKSSHLAYLQRNFKRDLDRFVLFIFYFRVLLF